MSKIIPMNHKSISNNLETKLLTREELQTWVVPPFQRPLRENEKVRQVAEDLQSNGGIIHGVISLGLLPNDLTVYLIDGQHRRLATQLSGLSEFIADVKTKLYRDLAEMAEEFQMLNSVIVRIQPDDVLRSLEFSKPQLQKIRKRCSFVGYESIRRNVDGKILIGMSVLLRCWIGSGYETPKPANTSAVKLIDDLTDAEVDSMTQFLIIARAAWGHDQVNFRLWGATNITMCMWLWRMLVVDTDRRGNRRYVVLRTEQFKHCLMALSASDDYVNWLVGRHAGERDRVPCYDRIRKLFSTRLQQDDNRKIYMPQPSWLNQGRQR